MWQLKVASTSNGDPFLKSLNNFAGRLTWEYDAESGSAEEKDFVQKARQSFTENRHQQQHSADVLYRTQLGGLQAEKRRKIISVKLFDVAAPPRT